MPKEFEREVEEDDVEELEEVEGDEDDEELDFEDDAPRGFWGLVVEPGKSYTQTVDATFKLSNASLADKLPKDAARTSLLVAVEGAKFVLCSLTPAKIEQAQLDHVFHEGEEISFQLTGTAPIHLTGYYLPEENLEDDDDYDDDDFEDGELIGSDEDIDEDDEDDEEGKIVELEEEPEEKPKAQKRKAPEAQEQPAKKQAVENKANENKPKKAEKQPQQQAPAKEAEKPKKENQNQQKEKGKQPEKQAEKGKQAEKQAEAKQQAPAKKQTLPNGLVIEDTKEGQGKKAKKGNTVFVQYTGKLASNGNVFDSTKGGSPFKFTLGKEEVIKGWDIGVEGMAIGGERRLTIPPALAYGAQGAPPSIPKNAKLIFDIKLVNLK